MDGQSPYLLSGDMMVVENTGESIINIESLIESEISYVGQASGRQYFWRKSGQIVPVLEQDVSALLETRISTKKVCCGSGTNKIFQIASGGNHA